jgi:ribosomal protein S18 acetylase RimI-like enzyme
VTPIRIRPARPAEARQQAAWIVALEPWRALGYRADRLGRWLGQRATAGWVKVATRTEPRRPARIVGIIVVQPQVLLGAFIALLAVPPEAAGQGVGRALVEETAARVLADQRWLFTSSDGENRTAGRFYRALGFVRVGRLPDLVVPGRTEILWRRGRPAGGGGSRRLSARS